MGLYFTIAARNLLQAKRRTTLLGLALGLVAMLLVLLMGLSRGLGDTLLRSALVLAAGHINVGGFYKGSPTDAFAMVTEVSEVRRVVEESVPGIDRVVDRARGWSKLISETDSIQSGVWGIDVGEDTELLERLQLVRPRDVPEGALNWLGGRVEDLTQPNTILLFASQAERLGVGVGDTITMSVESMGGLSNTADLRIVAIGRNIGFMSSWSAFTSKQVIRDLYRLNEDTSGVVMVYLRDAAATNATLELLREAFVKSGFEIMEHQPEPFWRKFGIVAGEDWVGQRLDLTTWEDETSYLKWSLSALDTISWLLVSVLTMLIVVGIMNSMWMAVRERTNEIGTMRAVGMKRKQVLALFIVEAGLLGLIGGGLGAFLGTLAVLGIDAVGWEMPSEAMRAVLMSDELHMALHPIEVLRAVGLFVAVTVGAAIWPAVRAARLEPVTAIHRVG